LSLAEQALRIAPLPRYHETIALAHWRAGRKAEALAAIQLAIAGDGRNASFQRTLAQIQSGTGSGK
jgi:hypothetical protein